MIIWKFLKYFSGEPGFQVKEIFIKVIFINDHSVAAFVADIGHQVKNILNLVDNEVLIGQFCDGLVIYFMKCKHSAKNLNSNPDKDII